jgi:hypothetical protein
MLFQREERHYADDLWLKAERQPQLTTMMILDAPTQHQLSIPTQVPFPLRRTPHAACGNTYQPSRVVSGEVVSGCSQKVCSPAKMRVKVDGHLRRGPRLEHARRPDVDDGRCEFDVDVPAPFTEHARGIRAPVRFEPAPHLSCHCDTFAARLLPRPLPWL